MKQTVKLFSLLLIVTVFFGCQKKNVGLNEEFTLDFNETVTVKTAGEKITVKFTELVEESRCRPGVQCVWAGQVAVRIQLDGNSESVLGFHADYPSAITYKGRTIHLLEVNYNKAANFGEESHCSLRMKVE